MAFSGAVFVGWIFFRMQRRYKLLDNGGGKYHDPAPKGAFLIGFLIGLIIPVMLDAWGFLGFLKIVPAPEELIFVYFFQGSLFLGAAPLVLGILAHVIAATAKPKLVRPPPHNIGNYSAKARKLIEKRRRKGEAVVRTDFMRAHKKAHFRPSPKLSAYSNLFDDVDDIPTVVLDKDGLDATKPAGQQAVATATPSGQ